MVVLFLVWNPCISQSRTLLTDEAEVRNVVTAELDEVFSSEDFLSRKAKDYGNVSGSLIIDVSILEKGKVATFFKAGGDIANIDFVSFVSDYILKHKFKFKLNKKLRYKIRYQAFFKTQ